MAYLWGAAARIKIRSGRDAGCKTYDNRGQIRGDGNIFGYLLGSRDLVLKRDIEKSGHLYLR